MNYYEKPTLAGYVVRPAPIFVFRMIGISERNRQWIAEHRNRFVEGDVMLALVVRGLLGVPFEAEHYIAISDQRLT